MITVEYKAPNDRLTVLDEYTQKGYSLSEEQNIQEGNFLIFFEPGETIPEIKTAVDDSALLSQIEELKAQVVELKAQVKTVSDKLDAQAKTVSDLSAKAAETEKTSA